MDWETTRAVYPHCWVVVEALRTRTDKPYYYIDELEVVAAFDDHWEHAWEAYKVLRKAHPNREFYMFHTDRDSLTLELTTLFGVMSNYEV